MRLRIRCGKPSGSQTVPWSTHTHRLMAGEFCGTSWDPTADKRLKMRMRVLGPKPVPHIELVEDGVMGDRKEGNHLFYLR